MVTKVISSRRVVDGKVSGPPEEIVDLGHRVLVGSSTIVGKLFSTFCLVLVFNPSSLLTPFTSPLSDRQVKTTVVYRYDKCLPMKIIVKKITGCSGILRRSEGRRTVCGRRRPQSHESGLSLRRKTHTVHTIPNVLAEVHVHSPSFNKPLYLGIYVPRFNFRVHLHGNCPDPR